MEYEEYKSVECYRGQEFGISSVVFDYQEELLWTSTHGVSSFDFELMHIRYLSRGTLSRPSHITGPCYLILGNRAEQIHGLSGAQCKR